MCASRCMSRTANWSRDHHEDVYVALREPAMQRHRQLDEHAQKLRSELKHHANGQPASGKQTGEP